MRAVLTGLMGSALSIGVPINTDAAMNPPHHATVIYSFKSETDGRAPTGKLLQYGKSLLGTTSSGGAYGFGTVFEIAPNGDETVIYSFKGGSDGAGPGAGLVNLNGTLFGTTTFGGSTGCSGNGCGTVFSLTPDGIETVLHAFGNSPDGAYPEGALTKQSGMLVGTTSQGGKNACGCGAVFEITTTGTIRQRFLSAMQTVSLLSALSLTMAVICMGSLRKVAYALAAAQSSP